MMAAVNEETETEWSEAKRLRTGSDDVGFWKAMDYEGVTGGDWITTSVGINCATEPRVHPRFLALYATGHKWVLGEVQEQEDIGNIRTTERTGTTDG
ncbi:hypothetical protein QQ045_001563 [Rhodiola kirilowii]